MYDRYGHVPNARARTLHIEDPSKIESFLSLQDGKDEVDEWVRQHCDIDDDTVSAEEYAVGLSHGDTIGPLEITYTYIPDR